MTQDTLTALRAKVEELERYSPAVMIGRDDMHAEMQPRQYGPYLDRNTVLALLSSLPPSPEPPTCPECGYDPSRAWDENHDQLAMCRCGHPYYRHFDTYEAMRPVGCKYCECLTFQPPESAHD